MDIELQTRSSPHSTTQPIAEGNNDLDQVVIEVPRMPSKASDIENAIPRQEQMTASEGSDDNDVHGQANASTIAGVSEQPAHATSAPSAAAPAADSSSQPPINSGDPGESRTKRAFFGMNRTDRAYGMPRRKLLSSSASC